MIRSARVARGIGIADAVRLAQAWILLTLCWLTLVRLRLIGMQHKPNSEGTASGGLSDEARMRARELRRLVDIAARCSLAPTTCLTRSLVLARLLRREGIDAVLRIGVRLAGARLCAHAWLESRGVPLNERLAVIEQYAVFDQPLPARAFRAG